MRATLYLVTVVALRGATKSPTARGAGPGAARCAQRVLEGIIRVHIGCPTLVCVYMTLVHLTCGDLSRADMRE